MSRCLELGREIFERSHAAEPRIWRRAWWQQRANDWLLDYPRLKARLFQFIDVLPALRSDAEVARHLKEYLGDLPDLPKPLRLALSFERPDARFARMVARTARGSAEGMSGSFIAGSNTAEAIANALRLREQRMAFTMDVLGEATTSEAQADKFAATYLELINALGREAPRWLAIPQIDDERNGPMPRANLSIKLTALDPLFDPIDPRRSRETVCRRLRPVLRRAREVGAFVNVDMESYRVRDLTLDIFMGLFTEPEFRDWPDVGIVVQAYLRDGERDLSRVLDWAKGRGTRIAIRLVKGAYWDSETVVAIRNHSPVPVWTQKWQSDANYERMARIMLEHHRLMRPAFASHNVRSLAFVMAAAEELGLTATDYEIQMLYGMGDPLKVAMVEMGQCLRVYCPYGELVPGMAYLIRRLLENTSNDSFLRQSFGDRAIHDRLLADPDVARPPSAPLPQRHYQDTSDFWPVIHTVPSRSETAPTLRSVGAVSDRDFVDRTTFQEPTMSQFRNLPAIGFAKEADRAKMTAALNYVRGEFDQKHPVLIGGEMVHTDDWIDSTNPSQPDEVVGRAAQATEADAGRAVHAAARAFESWRQTSAAERARMLQNAADVMERRRFELAALVCLEAGKPWREADNDLCEAVDYTRYYAGEIELMERRPRVRSVPGEENTLFYEPCGVAVVVSPWNFPLALLAGMTTAALAAGNCVVIKPSHCAPVIAARLVGILTQVGFPPGVVNYLPGPGGTVGAHLVRHPDVHVVAFTGSRQVGLEVIESASVVRPGQNHFKKIVAELGGKNAIIVDDDCNLDDALTGIVQSAFAYAGQKCSACSRAVVLEAVYDEFCGRVVEAAKCVPVGPADAPGTIVGPVIDRQQYDSILHYVEVGKREGRLLLESDVSNVPGGGLYVGPTLFADVRPSATIAQEEIFGPVLSILKAHDFEHAVEIANSTKYALTGGVYSRSPAHIAYAKREFKVGNLYINRKITGSQVDLHPFGGFKLSGAAAQAGGPNYLYQFCQARTVSENTLRQGFAPSEAAEQAIH